MIEKASDPQSRRVKACELCKGNGLIPVRLLHPARARVEIVKGGVSETVAYTDQTVVRCHCSRGERFQNNCPTFNHEYCVSQLPGGEEVHAEWSAAQPPRQGVIPF